MTTGPGSDRHDATVERRRDPGGEVAASRDLPNLDLMRALAVVLVLFAHLLELAGRRMDVRQVDLYIGRLGVLMFFVHTSLVLMMSLQRSKRLGAPLFVNFYLRRAFRIYPLSVVTVAVVLLFGIPPVAWGIETPVWSYETIAANLLLAQNLIGTVSVLGPMWSLPYELQMYLVLPVLFVVGRRIGFLPMAIWSAVVAVALGLTQPLLADGSLLIRRLDVTQYGPCFTAGVLAFALARVIRPRLSWVAWPALLLGCAMAYGLLASRQDTINPPWLGWVFCLILGGALPLFEQMPGRHLAKVCYQIAKYSYGIYLFHLIALWAGFTLLRDLPVPVQVLVAVTLLVLMPLASYHLVEEPMIRVGGHVAERLGPGAPSGAGATDAGTDGTSDDRPAAPAPHTQHRAGLIAR